MSLAGLAKLNIELTSKCDKRHLCAFCGHQDPWVNPITYGDMDFALLEQIRNQLLPGILISFHRDGEPTAYPRLADALDLFTGFTTSIVTHGLNLSRRADQIIDRCTTVTVSVYRGDPDSRAQLSSLTTFLQQKGDRRPQVQVKIVGDVEPAHIRLYERLGARVIRRLIHTPDNNDKYAHRKPTVPEAGVCLDFLHHPTIDRHGNVFICNRLDPQSEGLLGSLKEYSLAELWTSPRRQQWLEAHERGRREEASPLCKTCAFWGVPSEA